MDCQSIINKIYIIGLLYFGLYGKILNWSDKDLPVQEEFAFQAHALQNHLQSKTLFNEVSTKFENCVSSPEPDIEVKVELGDDKIEGFGDEANEENGDFEEAFFSDQGNKYSRVQKSIENFVY